MWRPWHCIGRIVAGITFCWFSFFARSGVWKNCLGRQFGIWCFCSGGIFFCCERLSASMARSLHLSLSAAFAAVGDLVCRVAMLVRAVLFAGCEKASHRK